MSTPLPPYEKLGAFYLGRPYDPATKSTQPVPLLYDSKDLVTHAVIVGMTGSGKTGLGVGILEEAILDGIPALVIDPKGDLGNLLLQFPDLAPGDFEPWVGDDEARKKGLSKAEFAAAQADLWRRGLADWDQDAERIRRLAEASDLTIYTPGSDAGVPISILASFAAPPQALREDNDLMADRISATVTGLLSLLGIDADPIRSREYILLATLLDRSWREGRDLDLGGLIRGIQEPPFDKVGVFDLESFFPPKERFELAMAVNNLLASPGFAAWLDGAPMDVDRLLYTAEGKPRVAVVSIAHLADSERMFFVSLLLNQVLGWMRSRPGTTSLRALLYMDEIFGFLPPVGEPPSKKPLLTLLKQARAFGVGLVLATQNPVDLDYKALSNAGTWMIGRLQTERDQLRLKEGLAAAGGQIENLDRLLAEIDKRVFLMRNVHDDAPLLFMTRWVLSYLPGPLTRQQIRQLMEQRKARAAASGAEAARPAAEAVSTAAASTTAASSGPPVLPPDVPQCYLPIARESRGAEAELTWSPGLLAFAEIHYEDRRKGVSHRKEFTFYLPLGAARPDWQEARELELAERDLEAGAPTAGSWVQPPPEVSRKTSWRDWQKDLEDHLYRDRPLELWQSPSLKEISQPGESERDFRIRLRERAREERDLQSEELRGKFASRFDRLQAQIRSAEQKVEKEKEQSRLQKVNTLVSFGSTLAGALFGRRSLSRARTAVRGAGRAWKEGQDVERAEENLEALRAKEAELDAELKAEIEALEDNLDRQAEQLEALPIRPRKTDVAVRLLTLGWGPYRQGGREPAWPG